MSKEIWKDIEGYEGLYQVSNLGRVKSLGNNKARKYKILKNSENTCGYPFVCLSINKIKECKTIHRLMALAFIPNPYNLPQVNHKNEIKNDNRIENLEWATARYNTNYSMNKKSTSKYPGVSFIKNSSMWLSQCNKDGKVHRLGSFKNEEDAAQAYICFCAIHNLK